MNSILGYAFISLGFASATFGALGGSFALLTKRNHMLKPLRQWAYVLAFSSVGSFIVMEVALFQRDYSLDYVRQVGSYATPWLFNFAAIWSSLEGSILLWILILGILIAWLATKYASYFNDEIFVWAMVIMFFIALFFFGLVMFPANPFVSSEIPQGFNDGPGPNPLLQNHILVAFHPPLLYLGYVGFSIPFSFAIASLITGRFGEGWLIATRRWALISWMFLTVGIILGAWWSYEVLGWGGFWAWDPVENASLLPWLTGVAYIHSVIVQEQKGMLRVWNISLITATFALTIFGTFLTRSGVFESVHAFASGSVGYWLLGFFVLITALSVFLIGWRGDKLASKGSIKSPWSREAAFLLNNFLFAAFAFVVITGTTFPLLAELYDGSRLTVSRPYFDSLTRPLGILILLLMGLATLIPWGKSKFETIQQRLVFPVLFGLFILVIALFLGARGFYPLISFTLAGFAGGSALRQLFFSVKRNSWRGFFGRSSGGMVVHLGLVILAFGLVASESYRQDKTSVLDVGDSMTVAGHNLEYIGSSEREDRRSQQVLASIKIDDTWVYEPAVTRYARQGMVVPTPSVKSSLFEDIYLILDGAPENKDGTIRLRAIIRPMVVWLWLGGAVMALGSILSVIKLQSSEDKAFKKEYEDV